MTATKLAPTPAGTGASTGAVDAGGSGEHLARPLTRVQLGYLLLITVLGAVLRLLHLSDWSLWVDEAHTWRDVTLPLGDFFDSARMWYPVSFFMLRGLIDSALLPQLSEDWLRLPFAFFGIVTVPMMALFGNYFVGRRAALLAALFLAINPWHIYWSQNARSYVLVCFFALLSGGVYWVGMLRDRRLLRIVGVLVALLGGACHVTGLALLPVFFAFPLLGRALRKGGRTWLWVVAVAALVMVLPYLLKLLPPFQTFQRAKPDASVSHLLHTTAFYFRLPLLCAAMTGVWLLFRTRMQGRVLFLACWMLVPLSVLMLVGGSMVKVTARYAFCSLPALMLLAGAASVRIAETLVQGLGQGSWRARLVPAAVLPVILCLDMLAYDYLYFTTQYGDRGRWRQAGDVVREATGNRQVEVYSINEPSMLYYLRPSHYLAAAIDPHVGTRVWAITDWEVAQGWPRHLGKSPPAAATVQGGGRSYLAAVTADVKAVGRELFFVVTLPELAEIDRDGRLLAGLQAQCELRAVLPCWVGPKDETIYVYQARLDR